MRKMARCNSSCKKRREQMKDRINRLPDEILIAILSLLTLKEAACTSILSHRWRYLWRYITFTLNFDSKTLRAPADGTTYVSWVNEVLKLCRGTSIDEMRISFDFYGHYPRDISGWIKFAMEKGVQRFELDVSRGSCPGLVQSYDFPSMEKFKFLLSSNTVKSSVLRTIGSAGFCSLTALRLVGVNITEEVLENFLSNCPLLEQLCVSGSTCLENLKIASPSLKLKCLEISHCRYLKNLEISAINLVSFTYIRPDIGVPFRSVPLLSELSIGGKYGSSFVSGSCKHSSYIPQIEKLKLKLSLSYFRELCNLKQVELHIIGHAGDSLLSFTSVIKASPNLFKFSVQDRTKGLSILDLGGYIASELLLYSLPKEALKIKQEVHQFISFDESSYIELKKRATKCHHQCLKVVELVGLLGVPAKLILFCTCLRLPHHWIRSLLTPVVYLFPKIPRWKLLESVPGS